MHQFPAGHPGIAGADIVPFRPRPPDSTRLSLRDRMDVAAWHRPSHKLVIHERADFDPPGLDSFLGIYRSGEPWARWNLARCGGGVLAWCSKSGTDLGNYPTVAAALEALMGEGRRQD